MLNIEWTQGTLMIAAGCFGLVLAVIFVIVNAVVMKAQKKKEILKDHAGYAQMKAVYDQTMEISKSQALNRPVESNKTEWMR